MQTENISLWLDSVGFTDLPATLQTLLAMATTLVSEDATLLTLAILKQVEAIHPWVFWVGGFAGIIIGDLLLYSAGRYLAKGKQRFLWLDLSQIKMKAGQHEKGIFVALMLSQFLPGSRFPSYVSAGISHYSVWLFVLSKAIVLPFWLFLFSMLGDVLLNFLQNNAWLAVAALALIVFVYVQVKRFNRSLANISLFNRIKTFYYSLTRLRYFEFWPALLFYWPVVFYIFYFTGRHGRGALPAVSNPGIEYGGWVGEDKSLICDLIPAAHPARLKYAVITEQSENKLADLQSYLDTLPLDYPIILKPEKGLRGDGVRLAHNEAEAEEYLSEAAFDILVQEYCDFEHEAGIFYVKYPDADSSQIFSITDKQFPYVYGDGKQTLTELILQDKRARLIAKVYFSRFQNELDRVLDVNEGKRLAESGNHAQGVKFLDGMEKLYTPELHQAFDKLADQIDGFYIGRFDVRYRNTADFRAGKGFKIIEINGAGAEATHIYDPKTSLLEAYRVLFRQFKFMYEIGAINAKKGVPVPANMTLLKVWWQYLQLSKQYQTAS